jgi:hypothetical protein
MKSRTVVLLLLVPAIAGAAVLGYLGWRKRLPALPPALADAYGHVATLASAASAGLSAPSSDEAPDAGDAGPAEVKPITQAAPLSSAQLSAPLVHGAYVTACGAPDTMKVVAKVTVKKGRAVAVRVTTKPPNAAVAACVQKAVREKQWDISPATQHATVTY